jgi:hypothetical protein
MFEFLKRSKRKRSNTSDVSDVPDIYTLFKKGKIFQIDYGDGYGYVQEVGESLIDHDGDDDFKISFVLVYERPFAEKIQKIRNLSSEKYFIGHFFTSPTQETKLTMNMKFDGATMIPPRETYRGFEFDYGGRKNEQIKIYELRQLYVKSLGSHPVPAGIELPKYLRDFDVDFIAGTYRWYIVKFIDGEFVKYQKTSKGIEHIPPYHLGFGACAAWWEERLTLETWNDEYCLRKMEERYLEEPELRPIKMSFEETVATIPTKEWIENNVDDERVEWYLEIQELLQQFIATLSKEKIKLGPVKKAVKELTVKLNEMQNDEHFIETTEREDLFTFISTLLRVKKKASAIDIMDEHRDW